MRSLYKRLLKHQSTEERSNLENFFTEILCDFLTRLDFVHIRSFIRYVLFNEKENACYLNFIKTNEITKENKIKWITQYPVMIDGITKYPDLIGFLQKRPVILIEAKLGAQFTIRKVPGAHSEHSIVNIFQLQDYGNWLKRNNTNGGLFLLTQTTQPPNDFFDKQSN